MLSREIKELRDHFRGLVHTGATLSPEAVTKVCVTLSRLEMSARSLELACPEAGGEAEPLRHLVERRRPAQQLGVELADWVPVYDIRALPNRAGGGAA